MPSDVKIDTTERKETECWSFSIRRTFQGVQQDSGGGMNLYRKDSGAGWFHSSWESYKENERPLLQNQGRSQNQSILEEEKVRFSKIRRKRFC